MRIMPLNKIAVIAIHQPDEISQRRKHSRRKASAKACRFLSQL